jgi:hypothetical protein
LQPATPLPITLPSAAQVRLLRPFRSGVLQSWLEEFTMARFHLAVLVGSVFLGVAGLGPTRALAQGQAEPGKKQEQGASYAVDYDIRDLARKPGAGPLVEAIVALEDPAGAQATLLGRDAIQVRNGTRLVIRASAARHAEIAGLVAAYRRLADVSVLVQARLYEVDEAFYQRLKTVKRLPLDELEERFLAGKPAENDELHKLLGKQKMIQAGDEVKADDGREVALLARQNAFTCLPGRAQVRRGDKARQTILEGVMLAARIEATADRRYVNVSLTEKTTHVEEVLKYKEWDLSLRRKHDAEAPFVRQTTVTRMLEIPDGGSILVPVAYRPASVEARARRWVLSITPRIYIGEEEQAIRAQALAEIVPVLVAAVLKNPQLKTMRDYYGSPDDKRFALLTGNGLTLPEKFGPNVAGYQLVPAEAKGNRLLGIRLDQYEEATDKTGPLVTVTLVNAGGTANGPAIGGCTIRYRARSVNEKWAVEPLER